MQGSESLQAGKHMHLLGGEGGGPQLHGDRSCHALGPSVLRPVCIFIFIISFIIKPVNISEVRGHGPLFYSWSVSSMGDNLGGWLVSEAGSAVGLRVDADSRQAVSELN